MTTPTPSCDRPASIGTNPDGTWYARCGCQEVVLESGTYEEATAALGQHRGDPPTSEEGT